MSEKTEMIQTEEIPRMEKVMRNFILFRYTEINVSICKWIRIKRKFGNKLDIRLKQKINF
jgi:hypothetical protein